MKSLILRLHLAMGRSSENVESENCRWYIAWRWWFNSRYDLILGWHNIGFVFLGCIFCLRFVTFSFTIVKTDFVQGVSAGVSNLFFVDIFQCRLLMLDQFQSRFSRNLYFAKKLSDLYVQIKNLSFFNDIHLFF